MKFKIMERVLEFTPEKRKNLIIEMAQDTDLKDAEVRLAHYILTLDKQAFIDRDYLEDLFGWSQKKSTEVIRMVENLGFIEVLR